MLRVAVSSPLEDKDWHNGESVVWLKKHLISDQKPRGTVDEGGWVINVCAEVAGCPGSILDPKCVETTMPFQALMTKPEGITAASRDHSASGCGAAFNTALPPNTSPLAGFRRCFPRGRRLLSSETGRCQCRY